MGGNLHLFSALIFFEKVESYVGLSSFRLLRVADDSRQGSVLLPATLRVRIQRLDVVMIDRPVPGKESPNRLRGYLTAGGWCWRNLL
jgi:hypothetical protein